MSQRKVVIIFYEGHLSVAPTIINIAYFFLSKKWKVEIITSYLNKNFPPDPFISNLIVHRPLQEYRVDIKIIKKLLKCISVKIHNYFSTYLKYREFSNFINKKLKNEVYDICIGVDTFGITKAIEYKKKFKLIIMLSLEIDFKKAYSGFGMQGIKSKEKQNKKNIDIILIQDINRYKQLLFENEWIFHDKVFFVPNSPTLMGVNNQNYNLSYFKDKFGISENTFIVLSAGLITDGSYGFETAYQCGKQLKNSYKLILHERQFRKLDESKYLQEIIKVGGKNLHLSLEPLPLEEIDKIYVGCNVGLAFYNHEYGVNMENIVFASGKLSSYLKNKMPIITNNLPGMKQFIEKYNCGIVIEKFEDLNEAINKIKLNYTFYSKNAELCFKDVFDFEKNFDPVYNSCLDSIFFLKKNSDINSDGF